MSMESAKAFIERMKTDLDFAKKVNELKTVDEAKYFVDMFGFDFTLGEYAAAHDEFSDGSLAQVVGEPLSPGYCAEERDGIHWLYIDCTNHGGIG